MSSNNPPYAVVELTRDLYELLVQTCNANHRLGMSILQNKSTDEHMGRKTVDLMERYKLLKQAAEKGKL